MKKLLIPSAKIVGEDLQNLGKILAVIYPVNGHTVFSYLYKQYGSECDSVQVLCYENADKVHNKLKKYNDIDIVDIPEIGHLAHTIVYGLTMPGEVIINFGDTIVIGNIYDNSTDSFYYAKEYVSDKWTYFSCDDGILTSIEDKKGRGRLSENSNRLNDRYCVFQQSPRRFHKACFLCKGCLL